MITAIGIVFKLMMNKLARLLAFAIEHWKVVVPAIIVVLALLHYRGVVNERDSALNELASYVEQVRVATEERKIENARKEAELAAFMQAQVKAHEAELDKLRGLYNATKDKSDALAASNDDLRKRLRDQLEAETSIRLSGGFNRPVGYAESGGNCDPADSGYGLEAYTNTLELACATTTSDYNTLYERCEAVNRIHGDN